MNYIAKGVLPEQKTHISRFQNYPTHTPTQPIHAAGTEGTGDPGGTREPAARLRSHAMVYVLTLNLFTCFFQPS